MTKTKQAIDRRRRAKEKKRNGMVQTRVEVKIRACSVHSYCLRYDPSIIL